MIAQTCQNNILATLNNALKSAAKDLKKDIIQAKEQISHLFTQATNTKRIKTDVEAIMKHLKIFEGYKTKISKCLKKLK